MSAANWPAMTWLVLCWLAYFAVHSALAALSVKHWLVRRYPALWPSYRLAYNGLAVLLLVPIVWLIASHRAPPLWAWSGPAAWLVNGLALAALGAFVVTLKYYDGREFIGLRRPSAQRGAAADESCVEDGGAFRLSPLHRYMRHPWYGLALVLIWTRDMDLASLVSALMMSAYFVIGARFEEAKLLRYHGAVYRVYMARVAGLVPLPWKTLSAREAAELEDAARRSGA